MVKLSQQAWQLNAAILQSIKQHPFIQQLAAGSLDPETFHFYIAQDRYYLEQFAKSLAIAANKAPGHIGATLAHFAQEVHSAELAIVHDYYHTASSNLNTLTPANLGYTNFLLKSCLTEDLAICIAALLPCFWVYYDVGLYAASNSEASNPFQHWINSYSDENFAGSVNQAIAIFDTLAENSSREIQEQMLLHFSISTKYEWQFWDDSFNLRLFSDLGEDFHLKEVIG